MISLQARIVKLVCRIFVKRALMRPAGDPLVAIRRLRARLRRYDPLNRRFTRGLRVESVAAGVRGEWLLPRVAPADRAVLYVHGGAFVAGSPLTHRRLTTALASESGIAVFAVQYRLAPEHAFPAALDDVLAAYDYLRTRGVPARGIVIAGDSAGGGLALSATLALSLRPGAERLGGALVYSPWTDLLGTGETLRTNSKSDDMLPGTNVAKDARSYAQGDDDARDPLASPLYGDLQGFPEVFAFASTSEILLDDARRFVLRAQAAGVPATLTLEPSMPHVWPVFYDVMPEARRTVRESAAFLRRVLGAAPSGTSSARPSSAIS